MATNAVFIQCNEWGTLVPSGYTDKAKGTATCKANPQHPIFNGGLRWRLNIPYAWCRPAK